MKSKEDIGKIVSNVIGFSTVCNNVKVDYMLAIGEGMVEKSLLLQGFFRKKNGRGRQFGAVKGKEGKNGEGNGKNTGNNGKNADNNGKNG